jgi:hypothetical protein
MSLPNKEEKALGSVYIPYVKGVSEKSKRRGNRYNSRTIIKIKHTLRSSLMKTRSERDPLQTAQCIYSIPCECGRNYIGETGRPLAVRLREQRHSLQQGLLEKSKLVHHAYEEGHSIGWDEARTLELESKSRYRKYKESPHTACLNNPIRQPSLKMFPSGFPLSAMRLATHRADQHHVTDSQLVSIKFIPEY